MSAQPLEHVEELDEPTGEDLEGGDDPLQEPVQVEVRRNAVASALLGAAASGVAIAYLWRAVGSGSVLDWVLCAALGLLGAIFLHSLLDARLPLLVADEMGVRIRLGTTWRGLPWDAIERVVVRPRRSWFRDGSLVVQLTHVARTIEGLEGRARRHAMVNRKVYGGALAVPLGLGTRTDAADDVLSDRIATLSQGRAEVVTLIPETVEPEDTQAAPEASSVASSEAALGAGPESAAGAELAIDEAVEAAVDETAATEADSDVEGRSARPRRRWLRRSHAGRQETEPAAEQVEALEPIEDQDDLEWGTGPRELPVPGLPVQRSELRPEPGQERDHGEPWRSDPSGTDAGESSDESRGGSGDSGWDTGWDRGPRPVDARAIPLRGQAAEESVTLRVDDVPERGGRAQDAVNTMREAVNPVTRGDSRVRAIAKLGDPVPPLVIDDYQPEPAYNPVIGPELAAARTRVGLSVDELADRTRIRPHVIESLEVDDFEPCGGDFYARGHIRTLSRVLGKDPVPLLELYEARYAHAPVSARKVFEAEMATGMGGQMARPYGGPNWTGLVAAVLMLVLVWAGVRLFAGDGEAMEEPPPVLDGSAGLSSFYDPPAAKAGPEGTAAREGAVTTVLTAVNGDADVEVRDADNKVVLDGSLVIGEVKRLRAQPPVTITSDDGGAVSVRVDGQDEGFLGTEGSPATKTFEASADTE